jgi:hypothetical protein
MTSRLRRRKAALTTYKPQHLSSDPYTLRDVGAIDKGCAQDPSRVNVNDAPQSTSNNVRQQPSNHSAKPSNTGGRADDLPAKRVSNSLRTKRCKRRSSINTSTHDPSPTNGRSKSEGEASEAEKKGRRQSRRLLDTKRIEEMSETSQSCDNAVSIQLACTAIAPLQNQVRVVKPKGWTKVHKTRFVGDAKKYWKKSNIETLDRGFGVRARTPYKGGPIGKLQNFVLWVRRSALHRERLQEKQKELGFKDKKQLVQDNSTRWNSTYYSLQRAIELRQPVVLSLMKKCLYDN